MKVLVADKFEKSGLLELEALGCEISFEPDATGDALVNVARSSQCQAIIVRSTKITKEVMAAASKLELIVRAGAGFDNIDITEAANRGIAVCNCPGKNSVAVAELTMGLMLALDRRIVDNVVDLRRGVWNKKDYSQARGLKGRTLGIIGLGRIGYEIAKRAAAFDMNLIYTDVVTQTAIEKELGIRKVAFDELLEQADFVSLHVPGGEGTKHLISREQLAKMKPTACIINCSRGGVIDEKALAEAIEAGQLFGAGLDVYELEPGAADTKFTDPVVKASRVYGTHHIGASTEQAQLAVADEVVRIIKEKMEGNDPPNRVN